MRRHITPTALWLLTFFSCGILVASSSYAEPNAGPTADFVWRVTHNWSTAMEEKYSEFVATMGSSGCHSLTKCLTSAKSNPAYAARTPKMVYHADCADLPFALRMYFAWVEGLPFDYIDKPEPADPRETNPDLRYTKYGNKPGVWRTFVAGPIYDFMDEYEKMRNAVSTATYRMHYKWISDFFPPALNRDRIKPGTMVYDPSGHVAIVYKIEDSGIIRLMDAHPDDSITHITFDRRFQRSRIAHGAGFKNWRPVADRNPTEQLAGFSTDEFNKDFMIGGEPVSYYDYVRAQMAGGRLSFDPVRELRSAMAELCVSLHDRETAILEALRDQFFLKPHPGRLPENIYGTSGDWETYATPARDARLKVALLELRKSMELYLKRFRASDPRIVYEITPSRYSQACSSARDCFLVASMMTAYEDAAARPACHFSYRNSAGATVAFSYNDFVARVFLFSFDPYHCPELRWGESGTGLATCGDDPDKRQWYEAEQGLRNQLERTYEARMDYDVHDAAKAGVAQAPDVDLWKFLREQLAHAQDRHRSLILSN